jgi:capsule biosynthesis phosphatase
MRIVIDLDGVICPTRKEHESYADLKPIPGAIENLKQLKEAGDYIILQTSRHMKTSESNIGVVTRKIAKITLDWLEKHQVPYDELYFGKPNADIYIDDRAIRFESWKDISREKLQKLAKEK